MIKFTKVQAGHYATEDGKYAVVVDGYSPGHLVDEHMRASGATHAQASMGYGGEWAAVHDPEGNLRSSHQVGETLDWFPTKREAVAEANRHANR